MLAAEAPKHDSDGEWQRLKALRSHQYVRLRPLKDIYFAVLTFGPHRLLNKTTYQKLDRSRDNIVAVDVESRNDTALLEDGLRNVMIRNDLDILINDGANTPAFSHAISTLKSLCATLDDIVNLALMTGTQSASDTKYPKLDSLLNILATTTWRFVMTAGTGRKLFRTTQARAIKDQVEKFNAAFTRLTQPDIGRLQPHKAKPPPSDSVQSTRDQLHKAIKSLRTLLSWIRSLTTCGGSHDVLLQLPQWDHTSSCEHFPKPHLDLYLSRSCCMSSGWQESRLQELVDSDHDDWCPADDLCQDIQNRYESAERLELGVSGDDVFVYYSDQDQNSRLHSGQQPSKSLRHLLQSGAFVNEWWSRGPRFTDEEKRTLAATLVLSFALSRDAGHLITCWDPDAIYFLTSHNNEYTRSTPYALCVIPPSEASSTTQLQRFHDNNDESEAKCALLARLLLEIECGRPLDFLTVDNQGFANTGTDTLEDFIYDQGTDDLSESRRSYLRAVETCYRFKRQCQRMVATGYPGGEAAAARSVAYSIVKSIYKRTTVHYSWSEDVHSPHARWKVEQKRWPAVSSEEQQLGMSNGLPLSIHTISPNDRLPDYGAHTEISDIRLSVSGQSMLPPQPLDTEIRFKDVSQRPKKKKVAFFELDAKGGQNDLVIETILDSPIATSDSPVMQTDDYEVSGNIKAEEVNPNLCKSARRYINNFKQLRLEKIGVQSGKRFKVAVLDTGVDAKHPKIRGEIAGHKSFVDGEAMQDTSGHGTHIAGLILDLTTNVDLYIGKILHHSKSENRQPLINALAHAREIWKVDMISLSIGFRLSTNPDLVQEEIDVCRRAGIVVFACASNDAGNKPRTYPGDYNGVLCIHSATGEGNKSGFSPSPESRKDNFSFVGDCINSCWPLDKEDYSAKKGRKCLSGTSIATPVAVSTAAFMLAYMEKEMPEYHWNTKPWSFDGICEIFRTMAHVRDGYDWVSPERYFTGDANREEEIKATLKSRLRAYIPKPVCQ